MGSFDPNPFGLYDTLGNAWEWCQDCWHANYENAPLDGSAWEEKNDEDCRKRVIRGGSFLDGQNDVRSAIRDWSLAAGDWTN